MSRLYPVYLNLTGRRVLVIGGGEVASRKVKALLDCDAQVTVISPELGAEFLSWQAENRIRVIRRRYQEGDINQAFLVIAACGDPLVNQQVFAEADQKNILCNVVDEPDLCSFQVPAVVTRGPLQLAVSTGGLSPALAREIADRLRQQFGREYEDLLGGLSRLRSDLKEKLPGSENQPRRAALLEKFIQSGALELLQAGKQDQFHQLVEKFKEQAGG